jgi:hypothetical protein
LIRASIPDLPSATTELSPPRPRIHLHERDRTPFRSTGLEERMGFLWDLLQQNQISSQREHAATLEGRVAALESDLRRTQALQHDLIERLERHFGEDLNKDGRVG